MRNDGDDGGTLLQSRANGAVPVAPRRDAFHVQPDRVTIGLEIALELTHEVAHVDLPSVADEDTILLCLLPCSHRELAEGCGIGVAYSGAERMRDRSASCHVYLIVGVVYLSQHVFLS